MEAKDFSTMRKTLRILQKVQASVNVFSYWINLSRYVDKSVYVGVTIFKKDGDTLVNFDFYSFHDKEERLRCYNEMMDYLNKE